MESGGAEVGGEEECYLIKGAGNRKETCGINYLGDSLHPDADKVEVRRESYRNGLSCTGPLL